MELTVSCLTQADRKILDYIRSNPGGFLFSSIGQLARQLGVCDATVSRFVRHVGCKDFKELKQLVLRQSAGEGPAAKMARTLSDAGEFTLAGWMAQQQQYLEKTLAGLDEAAFSAAVQEIVSARRVFIHAKSASAALGQLLFFRLRRLGIDTILLPSGGSEVAEGLAQAGRGDLVILFSFSKVSQEGRLILEYRHQAGYRTLAFTSRRAAPEEDQGEINLYVYRGDPRAYHTMTAPAAVVDALVVALSQQMGAESARRLSRLHQLKGLYR